MIQQVSESLLPSASCECSRHAGLASDLLNQSGYKCLKITSAKSPRHDSLNFRSFFLKLVDSKNPEVKVYLCSKFLLQDFLLQGHLLQGYICNEKAPFARLPFARLAFEVQPFVKLL